jgi:hypothetical protein
VSRQRPARDAKRKAYKAQTELAAACSALTAAETRAGAAEARAATLQAAFDAALALLDVGGHNARETALAALRAVVEEQRETIDALRR